MDNIQPEDPPATANVVLCHGLFAGPNQVRDVRCRQPYNQGLPPPHGATEPADMISAGELRKELTETAQAAQTESSAFITTGTIPSPLR